MSAFWFISLEGNQPNPDETGLDGPALARDFEDLDAFAASAGVAPISSFLSMTQEQIEEFREYIQHTEPDKLSETWFDAAEGLKTVNACLNHYRDILNADIEGPFAIIEELETIRRILKDALARAIRFHFSVEAD